MKVGLLVIFFVGLMLMTANAAVQPAATAAPGTYKYLPRDLDDYLREDANQPSILYKTMFSDEDIVR